MKLINILLVLIIHVGASKMVQANESKNILVILSGEDKVTLNVDKTGTEETQHETGFFLTELMVPLKALLDEGYTPTFATPQGTHPVMDPVSDNAFWFGGDEKNYKHYRKLCQSLGLCGIGRIGSMRTETFAAVSKKLESFAGVFFPGGHAPMEDLYKDRELGNILKYFHSSAKPTALICHAPIALLSAMEDPLTFGRKLEELNELSAEPKENQNRMAALQAELQSASKNWIYRDYKMTSFSSKEERQEEPGGADDVLGGFMKFYPDEALDFAGAKVLVRAQKWQSNVVQDRELITGQNPFSDKAFSDALIKALKK